MHQVHVRVFRTIPKGPHLWAPTSVSLTCWSYPPVPTVSPNAVHALQTLAGALHEQSSHESSSQITETRFYWRPSSWPDSTHICPCKIQTRFARVMIHSRANFTSLSVGFLYTFPSAWACTCSLSGTDQARRGSMHSDYH
jgi:hypothetical protein